MLYFGAAGLVASLIGMIAAVALLLLPFALGGIGGGDVKMMAALGALLGPRVAVTGLVIGMILGGAIMLVHLIRIGRAREKLSATGTMVASAWGSRSLSPLRAAATGGSTVSLPYSVPLGLGVVISMASMVVLGP